MVKLVIDEDMPRSTSRVLRDRGFEALDVRDHGLRGKSDQEVFDFARNEGAILLTADLGFGNLLHFPIGSHPGIIIVHFPNEVSTTEMNRQVSFILGNLDPDHLQGNLAIIEPGKIRIRRR